MISSIIYETIDFVYTLGRVTVRGISGFYTWYCNKETVEQLKIRLLEERISELEAQKTALKDTDI
jgi:hypothetical protein